MTVTHATVLGSLYTYRGTLNLRNSILGGSIMAPSGVIKHAGNLVGGAPKLGDKTGSPVYFPLLANSPAIDAADSSYCLAVDQRNVKRPQGNGCDIGAFEAPASQMPTAVPTAIPTVAPTPTSTPIPYPVSLNGSACSLADAITAANSDVAAGRCPAGNGADTITFRDDVILRRELPNISSDITFEGSGFSLSRFGSKQVVIAAFRLLKIESGATVAIKNLSLRNGEVGHYGGAIHNKGALTISGSTLRDNRAAYYGGAIYNKGTLTISNSTLRNNKTSFYGGAIYNADSLMISNSILRDNEASWYGGAIGSAGNLSISGSTLRDNETSWYGGAVYFGKHGSEGTAISCGTFTITNSVFSNNRTSWYGDDIAFAGALANLSIDADTKVSVQTVLAGACVGGQAQQNPTATPIPPTNTATPTDTPTSTATPTPTNTEAPLLQAQQADDTNLPVAQQADNTQSADLLANIDAKIAHHQTTGRADLVAGFSAAREALLGKRSPAAALAELNPSWNSDIWNVIRIVLNEMASDQAPPTDTLAPPTATNTPLPPPTDTPPPPTDTPAPPTATNTPLPLPTDTLAPPTATNTPLPLPTDTLAPPTATNTPLPPTATTEPAAPVDADLLAEVEEKIARHQTTGRDDLVAGFTKVKDALQGKRSASEVLAGLNSGWSNELWTRIRNALEALR
ncbi:MAG: right-handed parallel beta-helix repeat-containing protein [Chloroflexi bacterium]|nr:right-handed parallel beta-helix repeat-containing protein [Chloroflexota bacterium]